MKSFFEEYGLGILAAIVILVLFSWVDPLKLQVRNVLENDVATVEKDNIKYTTEYTMSDKILEVRTLMVSSRNSGDSVLRDFSDVADTDKTKIDALEQSANFASPFEGNVSITAGVWKYPDDFGGGVHLGIDYAPGLGTTINAPSNGVIVVSSDGCETGYLGDTCSGRDPKAVSYGGNQVYFITAVNNKVYVITFSHMQKGSVTKTGVLEQGKPIGKVGASGNATGPHCHIEVFYLGDVTNGFEEVERVYMRTLYSSSFGCGWGENALINVCVENTGGGYSKNESTGACRINPSTIFNSGSDANMDNIPYDAGKDKTEKKQNNNDENKEEGSE